MRHELKIGYLPLTKASWMNPSLDEKRAMALDILKKASPSSKVAGGGMMIASEPQAIEACELFRNENVDAIVCFFATFSLGTIVPLIANKLKVPVILWSMPEPPANGQRLQANSFCAANMNAHFMWKLDIPYFHVHSGMDEAGTAGKLKKIFDSIRAAKTVRNTRLGVIGGRVPGFYTSSCDEMLLRKKLGVEIKYIMMLEVVKAAENMPEEKIDRAMELIRQDSKVISEPTADELRKSAALYAAVIAMKEKFLVDSFAMRCWPEINISELYGIGVCSTIGTLTNHGTVTACEGDVYGAVMMILEDAITGIKPFFCDMIVMEGEFGVAWHCGAAPCSLCREGYDAQLRKSSIIDGGGLKGLTNEFPLRSGRVTLARLGEVRDGSGFRMLIAPGTAIDTDLHVRGNPLKIKFDAGCEKLRNVVINQGFEHHYAMGYGDMSDELLNVCKLMNIEPLVVK